MSQAMKINHKQNALTFGEFITSVYDGCGKPKKAEGIVRLAVNAHLVEFHGHDRFEILKPETGKFLNAHE
jgi:hypothetical protein